MPDTRQQSFDEIYGPPENFLEIEVRLSLASIFALCPGRREPYSYTHTARLTKRHI
jgi:hypothetical protein